ncbi:hypothetical protein LMG3410_02028 [Achromobacter aegrifaciens]|nr:hypothetical protein LMG3410_02028 [Achromobacter aegrifaciens]
MPRPGGAALRMASGSSAASRLMRWFQPPFMGRCREPVSGRRDPKRSPAGASIGTPQSGRRRLKNPAAQKNPASRSRSGRASRLRMSEFFSRRGCPAPFRCSPRWGCASDGSGVLGWQSPNALASDPFMGRCCKPAAGRRDPKRSPTGASIGIPQSGRRRLKNPASQHRSGRASRLRMSEFFSRRGCPAPFRCSPRRGCASDGSGVLGWQSPDAVASDHVPG